MTKKIEEAVCTYVSKKEIIGLIALIVGAILLRVVPQLDKVFVDGQVMFRGVDSWYHMRLTDAMMYNFPTPITWDSFALFPNGAGVAFHPLLPWIITAISKLGFNYEVVGAYLPAILGGILLVPVFFLCKELFPKSKSIPLVACSLIAILPGELLHRSLLGFTDHHILEVLLTTCLILFLLLTLRRSWKFVFGAGVFLGLIALNWHGAPFIALILGIWCITEFFVRYLRDKDTRTLTTTVSLTGGIGLLMCLPLEGFLGIKSTFAAFCLLAIGPQILEVIKTKWKYSKKLLLLTLIVIIGVGINIARVYIPVDYYFMSIFWGYGTTIGEAAPLTPLTAMSTYGVAFFISIMGLIWYIKTKGNKLFLIWSITMLIATIGQARWSYYFAISVAVMSAYMISISSTWVTKSAQKFAMILIIIFCIIPSIRAIYGVSHLPNNITPDWQASLTWLREETPEPYSSDNAYYELKVDESANYSIMSWWDYGHWISRIAKRVPLSSPGYQEEKMPIDFFAATNFEEANTIMNATHARYVIFDKDVISGKFAAIESKAGRSVSAQDCIAYNLWYNKVEGYTLVFDTPTVKVFEYEGYEK